MIFKRIKINKDIGVQATKIKIIKFETKKITFYTINTHGEHRFPWYPIWLDPQLHPGLYVVLGKGLLQRFLHWKVVSGSLKPKRRQAIISSEYFKEEDNDLTVNTKTDNKEKTENTRHKRTSEPFIYVGLIVNIWLWLDLFPLKIIYWPGVLEHLAMDHYQFVAC